MGLAGAAAFAWLVFSLFAAFRTAMRDLKKHPPDQIWFWRAIVVGYVLGLAGILTHGLAANTFIIVRIMEPFWFLTATVVAIPHAMSAKFAAPPAPPEKKPERKYALQPWTERW
jgi:quinol-cytochrome oxidoreductase complex cytochrome b subunit